MIRRPLLPALALLLMLAASPAYAADATLFGQAWPEEGGWGQAWGEDGPVTNEAPPPSHPVAAPTPAPVPAIAAPAPPVYAPAPVYPPPPVRSAAPAAAPGPAMAANAQSAPKPMSLDATVPPARRKKKDAGKSPEDQAVHLTADQIIHDRDLGIVTAKGHVEAIQNGQLLRADTISYNLKQDILSASGNITLLEDTGEVSFADYMDLTGDFKNGIAREIRVIMADHSRLAAASATRVGGDRTDFDKAVYTACEPCREHPERTPLWQAKAERVTHNQAEQLVEYRDVWLEVEGIPVAYTPYISSPDPTVRRKTGFLTPTVGMNSSLGSYVVTPYYWVINDQEDFTLVPRWLFPTASKTTTQSNDLSSAAMQRVWLEGNYRWDTAHSAGYTTAAFTGDQQTGDFRGHMDSRGTLELNKTWRAGWQVQRQTDDTYGQIYGYVPDGGKPWLTTRPYVEGFGRRDYGVVEGFAFQGLTTTDDVADQSPVVLPHLAYSHISAPGRWGDTWSVTGDALSYQRVYGTKANRLSSEVAWKVPYTTRTGEMYTLTTSLRGDGYQADAVTSDVSGTQSGVGSNTVGRVVPRIAADWKYPWVNSSTSLPQIITPMAMVAASPIGGNSAKIPNEDSTDFELDDTNVMRPDRMPGLDRVEGGVRGAYGLRWNAYPYRGGELQAQVAQGWRAHDDATFGKSGGFADTFSDYVGNGRFSPAGNVSLFDRIRVNHNRLVTERNEAGVSAGPEALNVSAAYGYFEKSADNTEAGFPRRHYINYSATSAVTRNWMLQASAYNDLADNGRFDNWMARAIYSDECFAFQGTLSHNYNSDRDFLAGTSFMVHFVFRTFADVPFNAFSF